MITISLCMIVKNEEDVLARCLGSVQGAVDQIVVVDTGSTDHTKEIAARYTDDVYDFSWVDDFAAARNFSFSKAKEAYILWLDADDVLLDADREKLIELKQTLDTSVRVVMMPYHTAFDADGKPSFSYYRERLLRADAGFVWQGAVHEAIVPSGKTIYKDIAVTHRKTRPSDPDRNLRIFEKLLAEGRTLDPRQQFYYAREVYYHAEYRRAADAFRRFIDSGRGWIENVLDACRMMAYCHYGLGEEEQALRCLLESLAFDCPRAEACCDIGKHFLDRERYKQAIFWFETALSCKRNDASGAFVQADCYDYIPCLQLCVCHDRLGNRELARAYNEKAACYKPGSPEVAHNRAYFEEQQNT